MARWTRRCTPLWQVISLHTWHWCRVWTSPCEAQASAIHKGELALLQRNIVRVVFSVANWVKTVEYGTYELVESKLSLRVLGSIFHRTFDTYSPCHHAAGRWEPPAVAGHATAPAQMQRSVKSCTNLTPSQEHCCNRSHSISRSLLPTQVVLYVTSFTRTPAHCRNESHPEEIHPAGHLSKVIPSNLRIPFSPCLDPTLSVLRSTPRHTWATGNGRNDT